MSGQPDPVNHPGPGQPVVFDLAAGAWTVILLVVTVCGGLGVIGLVAVHNGGVHGGAGARVAALVLSLLFLAIALAALAMSRVLTRPRKLIVGADGIRWDDPRGKPWYVPWSELAGVSISTATRRNRYGTPTTLARVDLFPGGAGFDVRHPELAHLWEASGATQCYRFPLGPHESRVPELDQALQTYARTTYRGVIHEGNAGGLRYT